MWGNQFDGDTKYRQPSEVSHYIITINEKERGGGGGGRFILL